MEYRLKQIAEVNTGIYEKPSLSGNVIYLQAGMFDDGGNLQDGVSPNIYWEDINSKHLLLKGDILFNAKGSKNFALEYDPAIGLAVASSTFLVVRCLLTIHNGLLPGYLSWFLNHPATLAYLKANAVGSALQSISKAVLQELVIPLPSLAQQEKILKIQKLRDHEQSLIRQVQALKEKLIQHLLFKAANVN